MVQPHSGQKQEFSLLDYAMHENAGRSDHNHEECDMSGTSAVIAGSKASVIVFPRKRNKTGPEEGVIDLSMTSLRPLFQMRQADAAKALGIAASTLKHACRQLGIARWPWRSEKNSNSPGGDSTAGGGWKRGPTKTPTSSAATSTFSQTSWKIPPAKMSAEAQRIVLLLQERASRCAALKLRGSKLHTVQPAEPDDEEEVDTDDNAPSAGSMQPRLGVGRTNTHEIWCKLDRSSGLLQEALDSL